MNKKDKATEVKDDKFVDYSLQLYDKYNQEHLFYKQGDKYNKLITADAFNITPQEYTELENRGPHLWNWLQEQTEMFSEIPKSPSLKWLYDNLRRNHSPKTLEYQFAISQNSNRFTKVMRVDLSSFPFNCHEAQLRWGAIGHMHSMPHVFDQIVPDGDSAPDKLRGNMKDVVLKLISDACASANECVIYLTPQKFVIETEYFAKDIPQIVVMLVSDFNEQNFVFTGEDLVHKATGRIVRLIFRRELTLETLSRTEFGRKVVDLYLLEALNFEPDLNLINDSKLGMAFAFDHRTKSFFSDDSRKLFLKTALYDDRFESFNDVFSKNFKSLDDFLTKTSQHDRKYIYKFGGYDLSMSFGSSHVYRLDRTKNKDYELISQTRDKNEGEWIMQELDETRYPVRYLKGNYEKPESCEIGYSNGCASRFMIFYHKENGHIRPISGLANFVNDYWKARFKDSDTTQGQGAIISPIRVLKK